MSPAPRSPWPAAVGVAVLTFAVTLGLGYALLVPPAPPSPAASSLPKASPAASPAASSAGLPAPLAERARSVLTDLRTRRSNIPHSFGSLVERTADPTSFMGLSPAELAVHIQVTRSMRDVHHGIVSDASGLVADLRAVLKEPETAPSADLVLLIRASDETLVESIEVLRYDLLLGVLAQLAKGGKTERLEDPYQGLKTICYPVEVLSGLARHAELVAVVLERVAAGEVEATYPEALETLFHESTLFTSYTVCGLTPGDVVRKCEERILARLSRLSTPAAPVLAALVADMWRTRSQTEPMAASRRAASVLSGMARLAELHPAAAKAFDRLTPTFRHYAKQ